MNRKTTIQGILTIAGAIVSAVLGYLKTGSVDLAVLSVGITAGIGLITASDAKPEP
jgi:hypothetical protein